MSAITATRSLSGAQKVVLAAGGLVAVALIAWGVLALVSLVGRTTYQRELTFTPVMGKVRIETNGSIRIATGPGADVRVTETVRYGLRKPRLTEQVTGDGLLLHARCPWVDSSCSIDAVLTVPAGLSVDARSSGGDITVSGLAGPVQLDSSGGGIAVSSLTGPLVAHSSGGGIDATGLAGSVRLDSSGGDVRATGLRSGHVEAESSGGGVSRIVDAPPDQVSADSSGGGVDIELPRVDGGYRVTTNSSGGDTRTDVPTDPESRRVVDANSSGGSVRILTHGAG